MWATIHAMCAKSSTLRGFVVTMAVALHHKNEIVFKQHRCVFTLHDDAPAGTVDQPNAARASVRHCNSQVACLAMIVLTQR